DTDALLHTMNSAVAGRNEDDADTPLQGGLRIGRERGEKRGYGVGGDACEWILELGKAADRVEVGGERQVRRPRRHAGRGQDRLRRQPADLRLGIVGVKLALDAAAEFIGKFQRQGHFPGMAKNRERDGEMPGIPLMDRSEHLVHEERTTLVACRYAQGPEHGQSIAGDANTWAV